MELLGRNLYILDLNNQVVPVSDIQRWIEFFNDDVSRRVASYNIIDSWVSTVFLGVDQNPFSAEPVTFETAVFGGPLDSEIWRYSSWNEAENGHDRVIAALFVIYLSYGRSWRTAKRKINDASKYNKQGRLFFSKSIHKISKYKINRQNNG